MSFTFVAENEEAEKLLNYIVNYRKSVGPGIVVDENQVPIDNVSIGVISEPNEPVPIVENPKIGNAKKKY